MTEPPVVLLLPGLLCDAAVWASTLDALGALRCHVADYGELDSIPAMARQALAQAPAAPLAVAGHSMGGRVALEIVRQAPQRVRRLALLDTGLDPLPAGNAGAAERAQRLALVERAHREGMRAMGRQWARGMVHPDRIDTPVFEAILDMIERKTPQIFAAQQRALIDRPDARPLLPTIACPTLLACGRQDAWSPLRRHLEMQTLIPGARLEVIEQAGHMSTMEQPRATARLLGPWLRGTDTAA